MTTHPASEYKAGVGASIRVLGRMIADRETVATTHPLVNQRNDAEHEIAVLDEARDVLRELL